MKKSIKITAGIAAGVVGLVVVGAAFSGDDSQIQTQQTQPQAEAVLSTTEKDAAIDQANREAETAAKAAAARKEAEKAKKAQQAKASATWDRDAISSWAGTTSEIYGEFVEITGRIENCPTTSQAEFDSCMRTMAVDFWSTSRELTAHVNDGMKISMPPSCKKVVQQTGLVAKRMDQVGDETAGGLANVDGLSTAAKRATSAMETSQKLVRPCINAVS